MIINDWLLLHPGKTAGTSIEQALLKVYLGKSLSDFDNKQPYYSTLYGWDNDKRLYLQHCDLRFIKYHTDINIDDYKTVMTVRDPLTRLLSAYYYNGHDKQSTLSEFINTKLSTLFDMNREYTVNHFGLQLHFAFHDDLTSDYIVRFETLDRDIAAVGLPKLGSHKSAKTVASKKYKDYHNAFSVSDKKIVFEMLRDDYDYFEYTKPF